MNNEEIKKPPVESCPHCGRNLSRWEQTLLAVDRELLCKRCWYRIILLPDNKIKKVPDKNDKSSEQD